jgi:hypothetical protein
MIILKALQKNKQIETYINMRLHQMKEHDTSIRHNIETLNHALDDEYAPQDLKKRLQKKVQLSMGFMEMFF